MVPGTEGMLVKGYKLLVIRCLSSVDFFYAKHGAKHPKDRALQQKNVAPKVHSVEVGNSVLEGKISSEK